ncbi:MAG: hypothetical protein WC365_05285 [Candidatus Babeliales bacterium]|jgi:hypothetical protein
MKKLLPVLAVAVLFAGAAQAHDHTNKTFLMPRAQGVNLPMEHTSFEEEFIPRKLESGKFGATFAITPFFQQSTDHNDTADYFLVHNKSTITLKTDSAALAAGGTTHISDDIDINYLYHDYNMNYLYPYQVNVSLDPEQTVYGARMDYYQNLGVILKNLYLKIDAPIVHVENDPELLVDHASAHATANVTAAQIRDNIEHYLQGSFEQVAETTLNNLQSKLTHAKIAKRSVSGVADVDVALGYKFINTEKYLLGLALGATFPTGNKANGEYMFEPIAGNGHHWGIGGDLYGTIRAWGKIKHNLKFFLRMKYRYLLENSENRTLGIQNYEWSQYMLLGRANAPVANIPQIVANRSLIPAANITTLRVDVTPGSQFDGVLGMTYNNGGFSFDLGYNLYYKEAESVHLKNHLAAQTYFVADRAFNTATVSGNLLNTYIDDGTASGLWYVDDSTLDLSVAETPSQFTNSIYSGLSYTFRKWEVPMLMGIGGKYEFASENSALEQWSIWYKMGVTF